ncbi:MAG: helix-turn-helix domain-containing protein [Lachnospiraceae bacterium]|nr:helix-turn-helix domain-containing protein [Lachnospiraceae bacterium]
MDQKRIGLFMKALRKEQSLTQEQLADSLFVSPKTLSRWETGRALPDLQMLLNIADFFHISITELINGERNKDDAETQKSMRMLSEYSERKERLGRRKMWWITALVLAVSGIIIAVLLMKDYQNNRKRTWEKYNNDWAPLADLKEGYSAFSAERDGCVVMSGSEMEHGEHLWQEFLERVREKKPTSIRIYQGDTPLQGQYILKELDYDGAFFRLSYYIKDPTTSKWDWVDDSYRCLNESVMPRFEAVYKGYLLADSPEASYEANHNGLRPAGMPPGEGTAYAHCTDLLFWSIADHPELRRPMYEVLTADADGDGMEDRWYLGYGDTSGLFTFFLAGYRSDGVSLGSYLYYHTFVDLSLDQDAEGHLCVKGVESQSEKQTVHLWQIVFRNNTFSLEENGNVLVPARSY